MSCFSVMFATVKKKLFNYIFYAFYFLCPSFSANFNESFIITKWISWKSTSKTLRCRHLSLLSILFSVLINEFWICYLAEHNLDVTMHLFSQGFL